MKLHLITLLSLVKEVISLNVPSELSYKDGNSIELNNKHLSLSLKGSRYLPTRLMRKDDHRDNELEYTMSDMLGSKKSSKLEVISESIVSLPDEKNLRHKRDIQDIDHLTTNQYQLISNDKTRCKKRDQPGISPNSTVDIIYEAKKFAYLSGVAYCNDGSIEDWNCAHCEKVKGMELLKIIYNPTFHLRAIILLDHHNKDLIISFRGSDGFMQAFSLMSTSTEPYMNQPDVEVQIKFKERTLALFNDIFVELEPIINLYSCYRKVLIGHSLGGAMAILTAPLLHQVLHISHSSLAIYTYNQPRVGNRAFATWYSSFNIPTIRVVNRNDMVPHLLTYPDFVHTTRELFIDDDDSATLCNANDSEDSACSNKYSSYTLFSEVHNKVWDIGLGNDYCHV